MSGKRGRPKVVLNEQQIASLRSIGMKWKTIASIIGVSYKTLYRYCQSSTVEFKAFIEISDTELDPIVLSILQERPNSGERMVTGSLLSKMVRVQRWRVWQSIKRVNPNPQVEKRKIYRRRYNVPCANALW
jgi:hypothetical protein